MALTPGTRLGPYEILSAIGAGGMGEVYRARDTKLGRDVALKVLPDTFASDPERLARMHREAQMLASLNHPNIAAIHGFEDSGAAHALVLEFVEGETLAERIARGPVAVPEALRIARQIAEALETAHEQGIIHRDLKPANIKVRPDGTVKVLDFGLAKAMDAGAGGAGRAGGDALALSQSPTITTPAMTQAGMILGTAAYMAPEQARGSSVDRRADIWAFGVVVYEMLTGIRLFDSDTVSDTLAHVLTKSPDFGLLPAGTPSAVRRLLRRCLERDPRRRLRDAGTAVLDIDEPETSPVPQRRSSPVHTTRWVFVVGVVAILAAAATAFVLGRRPPEVGTDLQPLRFQIARSGVNAYGVSAKTFAVSPDGRRLAYYTAGTKGLLVLMIRTFATGEQREVPDSTVFSPQDVPFWSGDSRRLAFSVSGSTRIYDVMLATVRTLCDCRFSQATWSRTDVILATGVNGEIQRLTPDAPTLVSATHPDTRAGERDSSPTFLPDGRQFLFTRTTSAGATATYTGSLDGRADTRIASGSGLFASRGDSWFLLGLEGDRLFARILDPKTMMPVGDPVPLAARAAAVSSSSTGVLVTSEAGSRPTFVPTWFGRDGATLGTAGTASPVAAFGLATDGRLALGLPTGSIAVRSPGGGDAGLSLGVRPSEDVVWSPDGRRILFSSLAPGVRSLYVKSADGTGTESKLFVPERNAVAADWSPDGRWVLFTMPKHQGQADLEVWAWPMDGRTDAKPVPYLRGAGRHAQPEFSPDGRFVAYISDESGTNEVYVQPFPDASAGKWRISTGGGVEPHWSPTGGELLYFSGQSLMAAPVALGPTFSSRPAVRLFDAPMLTGFINDGDRWHVSRDGRRFLLLVPAEKNEMPPLDVIANWPALVKTPTS